MKKLARLLVALTAILGVFLVTNTNASAKKITVSYKSYAVKKVQTHKTATSNSEWSGVTVKVDKIKVYKLAKSYKYKSSNDGTFKIKGFVRVHYVINSGDKDVSLYPTQGTYSFNNGEQHEADAMESWDGDISANVKKTGWVTIPARSTSNLSPVRAKFDASYDTDDVDDNSFYTYDMTIDF